MSKTRQQINTNNPLEIEKKYLIKMPTDEEWTNLGDKEVFNITQTYLRSDDKNIERRVRSKQDAQGTTYYFYTEKSDISEGTRNEYEKEISKEEYESYLSEADSDIETITKMRHGFMFEDRYFELDIYPFSSRYGILEVELDDMNEDVKLPSVEIVKDVTNDLKYRTKNITKALTDREYKDIRAEKRKKSFSEAGEIALEFMGLLWEIFIGVLKIFGGMFLAFFGMDVFSDNNNNNNRRSIGDDDYLWYLRMKKEEEDARYDAKYYEDLWKK